MSPPQHVTRSCVRAKPERLCSSSASSSSSTLQQQSKDFNPFDALTDDLVISIFVSLVRGASSPLELFMVMLTCKRFRSLMMDPRVLKNVAIPALVMKAASWCNSAHRFLEDCASAKNMEACYTLGMIKFYCLGNREEGESQILEATLDSHPHALHSLAVIRLNGSGSTSNHNNVNDALDLCRKAASVGHVNALRELGSCMIAGYGVPQNHYEGLKLLSEANAREVAAAMACNSPHTQGLRGMFDSGQAFLEFFFHHQSRPCRQNISLRPQHMGVLSTHIQGAIQAFVIGISKGYKIYFSNVIPSHEIHMANRFLVDWINLHPPSAGLRVCSYLHCGRPETKPGEFDKTVPGSVFHYCSWACRMLHCKLRERKIRQDMWRG